MMPKLSIYGTSKRAVRYATMSIAKEAEGSKVKIGALSPGMLATDFLKESIKSGDAEAIRRKKFYNILADKPEDVTAYLGKKILENKKNSVRIMWLKTPKVIFRFITAPFIKRELFDD